MVEIIFYVNIGVVNISNVYLMNMAYIINDVTIYKLKRLGPDLKI